MLQHRMLLRDGRRWRITRIPESAAQEEDFRFWYEELTSDERVMAVGEALELCLKARGRNGVPRLRRVHRRVQCPWSPIRRDRAHAVAAHARPRATKDLDVLIDPTAVNARRVLAALKEFFGGVDLGYRAEDFTDPSCSTRGGPVRIDILSGIPGCRSFRGVWARRYHGRFGQEPTGFLSLDDDSSQRGDRATTRPC